MPIFAVKNITSLKPGSIKTLYHRPSWAEIKKRNLLIGPMENAFKREFNLNERWYTLRVSKGLTKDGTKVAVLVLEHGSQVQVVKQIYHVPTDEKDIIGDLIWVGDLDNDDKLDLYFDEFNEKGYSLVELYLSSEAGSGQLVKQVASFGTAGC